MGNRDLLRRGGVRGKRWILLGGACAPRARMCGGVTECGPGIPRVAGRCLPDGGIPAIQNARRLVVMPEDVADPRRGDGATKGALPSFFTLGKSSESEAVLLLRFNVPLPKDVKVFEAYVLLTSHRFLVEVDPLIGLHAARIIEPWDGKSTSWALQPKVEEARAPTTFAGPNRAMVRVDVRDLVLRWLAHEKKDLGIAIVVENSSPTGLAFALTPSAAEPTPQAVETFTPPSVFGGGALVDSGAALRTGSRRPRRARSRLELYVNKNVEVSAWGRRPTDGRGLTC